MGWSLEEFRSTRAEIRDVHGECRALGWVSDCGRYLHLEAGRPCSLSVGEPCVAELAGTQNAVRFDTRFLGELDGDLLFAAPQQMSATKPSFDARIRGRVEQALLVSPGPATVAHVADVSRNGMGLFTTAPLVQGEMVRVLVQRGKLVVRMDAYVCNATPNRELKQRRVGLYFAHSDLQELEAWQQVLSA